MVSGPVYLWYNSLMNDFDVSYSDCVGIDVSVGELSPAVHWGNRFDLFQAIADSRELWVSLSEEERLVLIEKVRGSLAVMLDRVEEWLPDSFRGDHAGETLKIELNLIMADVDTSVATLINTSSTRFKESMSQLEFELEELESLE